MLADAVAIIGTMVRVGFSLGGLNINSLLLSIGSGVRVRVTPTWRVEPLDIDHFFFYREVDR